MGDARLTDPADDLFAVVQDTYQDNAAFRDGVWDVLFLGRYGFRPTSADAIVLTNYPDFADHVLIRRVLAMQNDPDAVMDVVSTAHRANTAALRGVRDSIASLRRDVNRADRETWVVLRDAEERRRASRAQGLTDAGTRSAMDLAATVIGASNPRLAHQVRASSTAMFRVRDSWRLYTEAASTASSAWEMVGAQAILVNGYVGAGLLLMNTFADTGPAVHNQMLQQVGRLRAELERVREEMHWRFDALESLLAEGLDALEQQGKQVYEQLQGLATTIRTARRELGNLAVTHGDTQVIIVAQRRLLAEEIARLEMAPCLRSYRTDDPMTATRFDDCRAKIQELANLLPTRQLPNPASQATSATLLAAAPDDTASWSYGEFRRLRTQLEGAELRSGPLPESMIGAGNWFYVADAYDRLLSEHPQLAASAPRDVEILQCVSQMKSWRAALVDYAGAIRDELLAYQEKARPTVFSRWLAHAWRPDLRELVDEWSRDGGEYSDPRIRYVEQQMEVRNAHLRAWLRLAFHDVADRSDVLRALLVGKVRLPDTPEDWRELPRVRAVVMTEGGEREPLMVKGEAAAEVGEVVAARMRAVERALQSDAMRDLAKFGYGHRMLMDTRFEGIDRGNGRSE